MSENVAKKDMEVLKSLARHRLLSIPQMAALHFSSLQMARRKRKELEGQGLVKMIRRGYGRSGGRPELLVALTQAGIERLQEKGILQHSVKSEKILIPDSFPIEHQLLLNWVCIHVSHQRSLTNDLKTDFLVPTSTLFNPPGYSLPHLLGKVSLGNREGRQLSFVPDCVFFIRSIKQKRALLFFVEVDMSTETISHVEDSQRDFRSKLFSYQAYFRTEGYKKYEEYWESKFNGFRLLIVTNTPSRAKALSRLVAETPPSDFMWITDDDSLLAHGISDKIWIRGGLGERPLESIVGPTMAVPSAIPIKS